MFVGFDAKTVDFLMEHKRPTKIGVKFDFCCVNSRFKIDSSKTLLYAWQNPRSKGCMYRNDKPLKTWPVGSVYIEPIFYPSIRCTLVDNKIIINLIKFKWATNSHNLKHNNIQGYIKSNFKKSNRKILLKHDDRFFTGSLRTNRLLNYDKLFDF